MCGILAILNLPDGAETHRAKAVRLQKMIRHRGPDWSGIYAKKQNIFCHERLAIVDPESGDQPLFQREDNSLILVVNGEIYNHKQLVEEHLAGDANGNLDKLLRTGSDCEPLALLYEKYGKDFLKKANVCGMFGVVIVDERTNEVIVARDSVGIIPLYYGRGRDGSFWVSSEMKCLVEDCDDFALFPPGRVYSTKTEEFVPFLDTSDAAALTAAKKAALTESAALSADSTALKPALSNWFVADDKDVAAYPKPDTATKTTPEEIRLALEESVKSHLMSDVPYGVLLSGGLDSSLVAAVMAKYCKKRVESGGTEDAFYPRLHSFCIGLETSPDHKAAQQVADFLGTVHHAYKFTPEQGIDALSDVIHHVETFDVTTIRSSTPMYLMARKIRATGVKMVLSGEGADEIFGGYLYFHKAPNAQEFHEETVRKVHQLHRYDCLRANKAMMAWSVEARVPFLDRKFLEKAFSFDPAQKMCRDETDNSKKRCEKYLLRKAFDTGLEGDKDNTEHAYLPQEVLWRQKEQFSDGVGYTWIDAIQEHAEKVISDEQLSQAKFRFPEKTPKTKEAYLYRELFCKHFGEDTKASIAATKTVAWQDSIACSSETATKWDASFQNRADASGRAVAGVHEDAYASGWTAEGKRGAAAEAAPASEEPDAKRRRLEEGAAKSVAGA